MKLYTVYIFLPINNTFVESDLNSSYMKDSPTLMGFDQISPDAHLSSGRGNIPSTISV